MPDNTINILVGLDVDQGIAQLRRLRQEFNEVSTQQQRLSADLERAARQQGFAGVRGNQIQQLELRINKAVLEEEISAAAKALATGLEVNPPFPQFDTTRDIIEQNVLFPSGMPT
jgi:hypothetical protein